MLTDAQIRKAKPTGKDYKLADSAGLYLFVTKAGFKSWRLKYRFGGKEKRLVFGSYPEIPLTEARDLRDQARRQLREHIDPGVAKRKAQASAVAHAGNTFERVARRWHESQVERWSKAHADTVIESMERDLFPAVGALPIREIDTPLVLETLRKVERRGAVETAHRLRQRMSAVFVHAISEGIGVADPAAIVTKALKQTPKKTKQPAIVELDEVRQVLVAAEASTAEPTTKLASRLIALTVVRPAIIRGARWSEFEGIDWDSDDCAAEPIWRVPAERMKLEKGKKAEAAMEHIVPLPRQAVDVLRAARRLTGRGPLPFPSTRHAHRPMSENAIGYLYNRVGYHGRHVPHGWRAAFSTIMNERAERAERPGDRAVIDLMLAHVPKGLSGSEGAYNRAAYMDRRRELALEWADLLMAGMPAANELLAAPAAPPMLSIRAPGGGATVALGRRPAG